MKQHHLYVFETPFALQQATKQCASKIGIAQTIDGRLGDYQQAYGPVLEASFEATWRGPVDEIRQLETKVLESFGHKVCANVRSLSEWVQDTRATEAVDRVEEIIAKFNLNIVRID
jgi:hypothetical protein